jgi:hypothetical protein
VLGTQAERVEQAMVILVLFDRRHQPVDGQRYALLPKGALDEVECLRLHGRSRLGEKLGEECRLSGWSPAIAR